MKNLFRLTIILCLSLLIAEVQAQNIVSEVHINESDVKILEVHGRFCRVAIKTHTNNTVKFDGEILSSAKTGAYEIKYERQGSKLKVWVEHKIKGRPWRNTRGILSFQVPASTEVIVDNSSGSVDVEGIRSQKIELKASSGSIAGRDLKGSSLIRTSSGSIRVQTHEGDIEGRSSSGSQHWDKVNGNLNALASSGTIRINEIEGDVVAKTSSGAIRIDGSKGRLDLQASSGTLFGERILLTDNSSFETTSGGIRMNMLNELDDFSFDLSASSGSLNVGKSRASKSYYTKNGSIEIKGSSSSGSQHYSN